jgi:hypothetical protein
MPTPFTNGSFKGDVMFFCGVATEFLIIFRLISGFNGLFICYEYELGNGSKLHALLTSTQHVTEGSSSFSGRSTHMDKVPRIYWVGGWSETRSD